MSTASIGSAEPKVPAAVAEAQLSVKGNYSGEGANLGLDPATGNAAVKAFRKKGYDDAYARSGAYIVSDKPTSDKTYASGSYYETTSLEYGQGLYVIIQDKDSTSKFYTLVRSVQDLAVGETYIYREGEPGGRLLDDKYTSTHMASDFRNGDYSYVSYDTSGGKLSAQEVELGTDSIPVEHQPQGTIYVYLLAETPADYYQRLANEAAGYEVPAQSADRPFMPVNNHASSGIPYNNWANFSDSDARGYNDGITRAGGMEGDSNTRLYSYSGQNIIVAKFALSMKAAVGKIAWAESTDFDETADYSASTRTVNLNAGETMPLYFHTQFTSTWGRDGFAKSPITYEIGDENVINYVGEATDQGVIPHTLTALKPGTTTLTATVDEAAGKYRGGASVTLTVTVQ